MSFKGLRDALDAIFDALVPAIWLRGSWAANTLGFWFTELLDRNAQFRSWCFEGRPPSFWMTGFFNPQGSLNRNQEAELFNYILIGFLTAMRQEVARAHKGWALDMVSLHNEVTKNLKEEIRMPPPVML